MCMLQFYEEIMEVCNTEELTAEQLAEMKYLDWCLQETMRPSLSLKVSGTKFLNFQSCVILYLRILRLQKQAEDKFCSTHKYTKDIFLSPIKLCRDPFIRQSVHTFEEYM